MDPLKDGLDDRMTAQKWLDLVRDENEQEMKELLEGVARGKYAGVIPPPADTADLGKEETEVKNQEQKTRKRGPG